MSSESSDESPTRGFRQKKRVLSSLSESDEFPIGRRKRYRVVEDDSESEDSSGSPIVASTSRRSRASIPLQSEGSSDESDSITDWGSDASDRENKSIKPVDPKIPPTTSQPTECNSDSSEGNSDKCPICLLSFTNQDIGTPENCEHLFCSDCLYEWSKNVNTCPVDRLEFKSILVRRRVGGKIFKRIEVNPRRPSEDDLVQEDPTYCEVCRSSDSEETMLLCDLCDLGYHIHCLLPPLTEIPENEWFCSQCSIPNLADEVDIYAGEVDSLWEDLAEMGHPTGPRPSQLRNRRPITASRSGLRHSRGGSSRGLDRDLPSTSRGNSEAEPIPRRRVRSTAPVRRRRRKRQATRKVVVEYEIRDGEKFPIKTKKVVKKRRKKAKRRAIRTAAQRTKVRSIVRGRLAEQMASSGSSRGVSALSLPGIPRLSLFGGRDELDYFVGSDDEDMVSGGVRGEAAVTVAPRSIASAILDAHRQTRRKMLSIPSPAYASSAPDILSSILESQTLLHSKNATVNIKSDGSINIRLSKSTGQIKTNTDTVVPEKDKKLDINKPDSNVKPQERPSYPRGGGGGGGAGGRRGGRRDYEGGGNYSRGGHYGNHGHQGHQGSASYQEGSSYGDGNSSFQGNRSYQSNNQWQSNCDADNSRQRNLYNTIQDRSPSVNRGTPNSNRGRGTQPRFRPLPSPSNQQMPPWQNRAQQDGSTSFQGNRSDQSSSLWQNNCNSDNARQRDFYDADQDRPLPFNRNTPNMNRGGGARSPNEHQISHWDNRVQNMSRPFSEEMSSGHPIMEVDDPVDLVTGHDGSYSEIPVAHGGHFTELPGNVNIYRQPNSDEGESGALPQPPIIRFEKPPLSEDEKSDSGLIMDTDKYDPMEPTLDESSSDEEGAPKNVNIHHKLTIVSPPRIDHNLVADYGSGSDSPGVSRSLKVSSNVLDQAVKQVIKEHQDLITGTLIAVEESKNCSESDGESDGDCPNFSMYSATSMDIAKNKREALSSVAAPEGDEEQKEEDLVQEDDAESDEESHLRLHTDDKSKSLLDQNYEDIKEDDGTNECDKNPDEDITLNDTDSLADEVCDSNKNTTPDESTTTEPAIEVKPAPKSADTENSYDLYGNDDYDDMKPEDEGDCKKDEKEDDKMNITDEKSVDELLFKEKIADDCSTKSESLQADLEHFTESISDGEDERSYTPCLDENKSTKSKDTSLESEKETTGICGLDTEMISEDEGNEIFSDPNNMKTDSDGGALELSVRETELQAGDFEEGEIVEKNKQKIKAKVKELLDQPEIKNIVEDEDDRKKKKREKKPDKEVKEKVKGKSKKSSENPSFKKLSKSGKERNYRERDDKNKNKGKDKRRSRSADKENKEKKDRNRDKKKEKRKDIERYDVRNVISDKSRRVKDAFGRDTSRPRSRSAESRLGSPRIRRSISRRRSLSRGRKSVSKSNRSISKGKRSASPKRQSPLRGRRSISRKRSVSRGRKSLSRDHKSPSPRMRRSVSPRPLKVFSPRRRSITPRGRSPLIRNRRSISPRGRRSKSRVRRSLSRNRNKRLKRSISRGRKPSPRIYRAKSPRRRISRRSRSKGRSISRNRSRTPKNRKSRKLKRHRSNSSKRKPSRSPIKSKLKRRRSRSVSPGIVFSRSPSRDNMGRPQWHETQKSPLYQDWTSGSQSMSPSGLVSPSWTPPPMDKCPDPRNLRVILTTKDKTKKKEKKRKMSKRNKASDRILKHQSKDTGPSKEVFTSGNNILVSVSFNKNQEVQDVPVMPPPEVAPKKKKRKAESVVKPKKDKIKEKGKKKRIEKGKRTKDLSNKKPVAIIDLDKSPFKELTPSPKAVIVLSDSDNGEKEEELMERQEMLRGELMEMGFPQSEDLESLPRSPMRENTYVNTAGPKTPPEPAIKFTIVSKTNPQLRAVNPLHEDEDENAEDQDANNEGESDKRTKEAVHKGPNTPPEPPNSPPSSPDVYDPFEPTKSGSATPERDSPVPPQIEVDKQIEKSPIEHLQVPSMSLEAAQKSHLSADDVIQARPISPMEKVMALLKSTRSSLSPANLVPASFTDQLFESMKSVETDSQLSASNSVTAPLTTAVAVTPVIAATQSPERSNSSGATVVNKTIQSQSVYSAIVKPNSPKPVYSTVTPTIVTSTPAYLNPSVPRIGAFITGTPPLQRTTPIVQQRILLPSPTKSSPLKTSVNKLFSAKPSPIKSTPIKPMPSKTIISKLPMPTIKPLPARNQKMTKAEAKMGQNGNDVIELDTAMDSPYSPGSSDFGDLFEPPSDNGKHSNSAPSLYPQKKPNSKDVFESLFGMKSTSKNANKSASAANKASTRQGKKPKSKTIVGVKMDEDSLKILDDLPSSAVEMQVKSKFLKKLNRQERVVEEVKLVLKPHYNKKHVTKEEYKEILRRAVPKICHNRSGEINPAKIQALIEAYVRKFRKKAHQVK